MYLDNMWQGLSLRMRPLDDDEPGMDVSGFFFPLNGYGVACPPKDAETRHDSEYRPSSISKSIMQG